MAIENEIEVQGNGTLYLKGFFGYFDLFDSRRPRITVRGFIDRDNE